MQEFCSAHALKVLLIEDNGADARLVEALLEDEEDITLHCATDLAAALGELGRERYDAILLDLLLPDARGIDLIETMQRAAPEAAVIVSSGQAAGDCLLARAIIRKGAEDYLPKAGLTTALLARTITTAVERRRLSTALRRRAVQLETALIDAQIGHLTWVPGRTDVAIAGDLMGLLEPAETSQTIPARVLLRRMSQETRHRLYALWREVARGAERLAVVLVEHEHEGRGRGRDLLVEAVAERDVGGRIVRIDALLRDTGPLGDIERLESEMLAQMGHALRTPLTTIRGALGLLAHGHEQPLAIATKALVDNAIANADRISKVIGETLETVGADNQSVLCHRRLVPLGPYLYEALAARLSGAARTAINPTQADGVALTLTQASQTTDIMVDAAQLRRAIDCLFALLANSAPGADRLALDVTLHRDFAWLRIEDRPETGTQQSATESGGRIADLRVAVPLAA